MGGIFGGGSSQTVQPVGQSTTVQKSEPWEGQKSHLTNIYGQAQNLSGTPPTYYPGSTVTPFSQQTEDALNSIEGRARTGSGVQAAGNQQMLNTIQGGYLNANPYLDSMYNRAARPVAENFANSVAPSIQAQFGRAGRYGSGLYQQAQSTAQDNLGRTLGEMGTDIYGRAYESERGRQQEAIRGAPEYAAKDYQDAQALMGVGGQREAQASMQLQDLVNRYNFDQQAPWSNLGNYASLVQGDYGRTQQTTQPIYQSQQPSGLETLLGGAGSLGLLGIGAKSLIG